MKAVLCGILLAGLFFPAGAGADTFGYDAAGRLEDAAQGHGLLLDYGVDAETNVLSALSNEATGDNGIADWWENFFFGASGINALASAAGDGVSNLTKFTLGLNPLAGISSPLVSVGQQVFADEQTYLVFAFVRDKANAAMVALEQSSD